jgi:fructose-specific phosphotransferase system IIA component
LIDLVKSHTLIIRKGTTMALFDSIEDKIIKIPLKSRNKKDVIPELVKILKDAGKVHDAKIAVQDVLFREDQSSTGLGGGIAIPHAKTKSVDKLAVAVGISPRGIDFDSLDDEPVYLFFLILSVPEQSGEHLQVLSEIAKVTKDQSFCESLIQAKSSSEVAALILAESL